jgi:hypothetical protein
VQTETTRGEGRPLQRFASEVDICATSVTCVLEVGGGAPVVAPSSVARCGSALGERAVCRQAAQVARGMMTESAQRQVAVAPASFGIAAQVYAGRQRS